MNEEEGGERKVSRTEEDKEEGKKREESEGNNFALINIQFISTDRSGRGDLHVWCDMCGPGLQAEARGAGPCLYYFVIIILFETRLSCLPGFYVLVSVSLSVCAVFFFVCTHTHTYSSLTYSLTVMCVCFCDNHACIYTYIADALARV